MGTVRLMGLFVIGAAVMMALGLGIGAGAAMLQALQAGGLDPNRLAVPAGRAEGDAEPAGDEADAGAVGPATPALIEALRAGGHVIYLRHSTTNREEKDAEALDVGDCATQRNLNEEGRAQARAVGAALAAHGIPIGEVQASPLCRTRETAELAFGRVEISGALYASNLLPPTEVDKRAAVLRGLLGSVPPAGTNHVIVGHWQNLKVALDIQQDIEGEAAIFRPDGQGGFRLVARVTPDGW